jgi:hypothetical protein
MPAIVLNTIADLRTGRSTWRVAVTCAVPSFAIAFVLALVRFAG